MTSVKTTVHVVNATIIKAQRAAGTTTAWLSLESEHGLSGLTLHIKDGRDISRVISGLQALSDLQLKPITDEDDLKVVITGG